MKNKLIFPTENTIVNFANSIIGHFNVPTHHETIKEIDDVLKGHKKVVVMLFDGLGSSIRKYHLDEKSSLNQHFIHKMSATYPPTTVASTNGLLSALYPIENGWLGWRQYYENLGCNILVFRSLDPDSKKYYESPCGNLHKEQFGYKTIMDQINEAKGKHIADAIFPVPVDKKGPKSLFGFKRRINKYLKDKDECFLYVYNTQPDTYLHIYGVKSKQADRMINKIDCFVDKISKKNKDTLFLVIADHGLVDIKTLFLKEHPDLEATFIHQPSLEGRTCTFFIKEDKKQEFEELFNKYYEDKFILMNKKEVLESNVFGKGVVNEKALQFIGDYVAISTSEYFFDLNKEYSPSDIFIGHHAGYTKEELDIDISAFNA